MCNGISGAVMNDTDHPVHDRLACESGGTTERLPKTQLRSSSRNSFGVTRAVAMTTRRRQPVLCSTVGRAHRLETTFEPLRALHQPDSGAPSTGTVTGCDQNWSYSSGWRSNRPSYRLPVT